MRIELENLTETETSFAHTYTPDELSLEDERVSLAAPLRVELRARRKGEEVILRGSVAGEVEVACDRCLRAVRSPLAAEFEYDFTPQDAARETEDEGRELHAEDFNRAVYDESQIDMDALVREQVLLETPSRAICDEPCKGLCAKCGANLNEQDCGCAHEEIDPRWSALAGLKEKE